jgi:hypothetical protein
MNNDQTSTKKKKETECLDIILLYNTQNTDLFLQNVVGMYI